MIKRVLAIIFTALAMPAWAADITGAGATFPYPIYSKWAEGYKKQTGVGLNYQSIGSSGGVRQINARTVAFGATDAPVSGADLEIMDRYSFRPCWVEWCRSSIWKVSSQVSCA